MAVMITGMAFGKLEFVSTALLASAHCVLNCIPYRTYCMHSGRYCVQYSYKIRVLAFMQAIIFCSTLFQDVRYLKLKLD